MENQRTKEQKSKREKRIIIYFSLFVLGIAIIAAIDGRYVLLITLALTAVVLFIATLIRSYLSKNDREVKLLKYTERPIGTIAFGLLLFVIALAILNHFTQ